MKWFNNSTERLFDYRYAYVFNSETVIESIQNGDNDVFEKTDPEKFELPKADAEPIIYSNNEFFLLANAAYRYQWNEDIGESEITEILYVLRDCRMDGNTSLRLVSIKKAEDLEKNTRITREVGVLSWESGVTLREFADSNVFMDKGIDLNRLIITADQALALVEEQMGDEILTLLKKRCAIISINMDNDKPLTWKINFTDADLNHFYIYVDAKSGEIREKE